MTPAEERYAALWLSEMWAPIRPVPAIRRSVSPAMRVGKCASCAEVFQQRIGPGRPRKYCRNCVPEKVA